MTGLTHNDIPDLTLLGVDWGERRIGLAVKPAGQDWPLPSRVINVSDEQAAIAALKEEVKRSGAQAVVVGLPLHSNPSQAQRVKRFCRKARRGIQGVRWFFVDEALTSEAADTLSLDHPRRRPTDDLAAMLILKRFMNEGNR